MSTPENPPKACEVLEHVFTRFRVADLPFLVLRNYEALPLEWGNDIDILVSPADLEPAQSIVQTTLQEARINGSVQVMRRINYRATRCNCADRVLHIDLLSGMSKAWFRYADTAAILGARRPFHPLFDTPAELHELLIIAAKELFAYGNIRGRYHPKLAGHNLDQAKAAAEKIFGQYMRDSGKVLVAQALVDPTVKGRPGLRPSSVLRPAHALQWARLRRNGWSALPSIKCVDV